MKRILRALRWIKPEYLFAAGCVLGAIAYASFVVFVFYVTSPGFPS